VPKRRQKTQQEFFVGQSESPVVIPEAGDGGGVIALDWFEQTLRTAEGPARDSISVRATSLALSPEDLERLQSYQICTTRESRLGKVIGHPGDVAESLPRLLAVYYALGVRPQSDACLVISVGRIGGKGGLVSGGELIYERALPQELSLRGIWSQYLESNAPLRSHVEMLRGARTEAEQEVFDGFARALKTGETYDEKRIRLRPPLDFKSSLPGLISFCRSVDPNGEAKTVILADWAATHCNLADLLAREYPTVLRPAPRVAFDQAVIGLIAYGLERKKREEEKNVRGLADLGARLERLSSEPGPLQIAELTEELAAGLRNISPTPDPGDESLSPYLRLAEHAAELRQALRQATSSPPGRAGEKLKELEVAWARLARARADLEARLSPFPFIPLIEGARRHGSLQERADLLKNLLGLEEIEVVVGAVLSSEELKTVEVVEIKGAGDIAVVDGLVERGYRDSQSKLIIKRPKVRARFEARAAVITRSPARTSTTPRKTTAPRPKERRARTGAAPNFARTETAPDAGRAQSFAGRGQEPPPAERARVVTPPPATRTGASSAPKVAIAALAVGALLLMALGIAFYKSSPLRRLADTPAASASPPEARAEQPPARESGAAAGDTAAESAPDATTTTNVNANANTNTDDALSAGAGLVSVSSNLSGVRVLIGNSHLYLHRRFSAQSLDLAPGQYGVRAAKAGYPDWSGVVIVRPKERASVFIAFDQARRSNEQPGRIEMTPLNQPRTKTPQEVALQHLDFANRLYQQRDYNGAIAQAREGLRHDPNNGALLQLRSNAEAALRALSTPSSAPTRETFTPREPAAPVERRTPAPPAPPTYQPPVVTSRHIPSYPQAARAFGASGAVEVKVTIDEQGRVVSAKADNGHPLLRRAAEDAARRWRFSPARRGGQPVPDEATITFKFERPG
jgi:TonB family protein